MISEGPYFTLILDEAFKIIAGRCIEGVEVKGWLVLKRYLLLELSTGVCGVAYYPYDLTPTAPKLALRDPLDAAKLCMSRVAGRRAVGVAALNALTWALKPTPPFKVGDPLDSLDFKGKSIGVVGYFKPIFWRFKSAKSLKIVERKKMKGVYPPEKAEEVLSGADIVLITGSCLVYGGLERYLKLAKGAEKVIVLGPTSSMTPEPFFKRGADIVAGVKIDSCSSLSKSRGRADDVLKASVKVYFERG
ncbi:MAG: DUF364 domain-containing protein [Nitrososphaerales archaeon]